MRVENSAAPPLSDAKKALLEIRRLRDELARTKQQQHSPVAIVGSGLRFPGGAANAEQYWQLLAAGTDAIREIPPSRWNVDEYYHPDRDHPGTMYTRAGGFLDEVDTFDPQFFGIAPREAESMDPQHRLSLMVVWEALENAGMAPSALGGKRGGVFVGLSNSDYARLVFADPRSPDTSAATGNSASVVAGRISYLLGLQGPAMVVDTACSSSLVAAHLAVQSLRRGECDFALVGGVNLILTPEMHINFCRTQMLSADGRCKTFDAAADGYSRGEGCGFIVLKRLDDAVAGNDRILAVLRGSAVNQDGASAGLTAPNGVAQEAVIREALADAAFAPQDVSYVEAHGTGTPLGDPIEARALGAVLGRGRDAGDALLIGSVKTNIGHLESAAGIAGLIKAALVLHHRSIPAVLHFRKINPEIPLADLRLRVAQEAMPWPDGRPLVAGVSSFGFSGTNAHVLLEAAPEAPPREAAGEEAPKERLIALSARSEAALADLQQRYVDYLARTDRPLADIAYTSTAGRSHFEHRLAVVAASVADGRRRLAADADDPASPQQRGRVSAGAEPPRIVLLFSGQGCQYAGMGSTLYREHAIFRDAVDRVTDLLDHELRGLPVRDVMFDVNGAGTRIDETLYTQPAVFAMAYALWRLWQSWGVVPDAVLGHSLGEYMAAHAAGVLSLEDAVRLVTTRARLAASLPPGSMAAMFAGESAVRAAISSTGAAVAVAAINGPANTVISGVEADVEAVIRVLEKEGVEWRKLKISNAFHSSQLDAILAPFADVAAGIRQRGPEVALLSNLSGDFLPAGKPLPARYWVDHLRNPVRFGASIARLDADARTIFVEIGPHPVLLGMVEAITPQSLLIPSLQRAAEDWPRLLQSVADLYVNGVELEWSEVWRTSTDRSRPMPAALPTYPFRRDRYWLPEKDTKAAAASSDRPWKDMVRAARTAANLGPLHLHVDELPAAWRALRTVTVTSIVAALRQLGVLDGATTPVPVESAMQAAGILPAYGHLIRRWLKLLSVEGRVRFDRNADTFAAGAASARSDAAEVLAEALAEARRRFRAEEFVVDYIERCGKMLPDVLTGRTPALETLFPEGQPDLAEKLYTQFSVSRYISGIASAAVAAKVGSHTREVRVLEIGAGTGGTTAAVLPALPGGRTSYCFTDISDFFLTQAAERFADYDGVDYRILDIGADLEPQGYSPHQFDIVIATNVLHATPDLRRTLGNVLQLLAGDGVLVLCEVTRELEWYDISTGLIEGWQSFADDLRHDSPLLPAAEWSSALSAAGFQDVVALPETGTPADAVGQSVILALAPAGESASAARPTVERPATAAANRENTAAGLRAQLLDAPDNERFDRLVEHVLGLVTAILRLPADDPPDARGGLFDLGMDSLMALDFRRRLAQSLDLDGRLPATLIFDHPNAESIARYLEQEWLHVPATSPATAAAAGTARAAAQAGLSDDELAELSDEEVEALLMERLESGAHR